MGQISFRYGNYDLHDASFTLNWGVKPSVGTITVNGEQAKQLAVSVASNENSLGGKYCESLTISDGDNSITIPNLYVTQIVPGENANSPAVAIIKDRRWLWKFGAISGTYNTLDDEGKSVITNTAKTWQELIENVWDSIPFTDNLILEFPDTNHNYILNENLPLNINWKYEKPVEVLQELLDFADCVLCFCPIEEKVKVCKRGYGDIPIPENKISNAASGNILGEKASELVIVGSPIRNEVTLSSWSAVGRDLDGNVKAINSLSYKPTASWESYLNTNQLTLNLEKLRQDLPAAITSTEDKETAIDLAEASVFKWYKIPSLTDNESNNYLPILSERCSTTEIDNVKYNDSPMVKVQYARKIQGEKTVQNTSTKHQLKSSSFTFDLDKGLVKFANPMVKYSSGTFSTADVDVTFAYEKNECYKYGSTNGTRVSYIKKPEFVLWQKNSTDQNKTELDLWAVKIKDELLDQQRSKDSKIIPVTGVYNQQLNGIVNAINWKGSLNGLITTIYINDERLPGNRPTYNEIQAVNRVNRNLSKTNEINKTTLENTEVVSHGFSKAKDWLYVYNDSGSSVSEGDVVVSKGLWDSTSNLLKIGKATEDSDPLTIGVAMESAANGKAFRVQTTGYTVVNTSGTVTNGDRLGVSSSSFNATVQSNGNLGVAVANVDTNKNLVFFSNNPGFGFKSFANGTQVNEATPTTAFGQTSGEKTAQVQYVSGNRKYILLPFSSDGQQSYPANTDIMYLIRFTYAFSEARRASSGTYSNEGTIILGVITQSFTPSTVTWNTMPSITWYNSANFKQMARNVKPEATNSEAEGFSSGDAYIVDNISHGASIYGLGISVTATQSGSPDVWSSFASTSQASSTYTRYIVL